MVTTDGLVGKPFGPLAGVTPELVEPEPDPLLVPPAARAVYGSPATLAAIALRNPVEIHPSSFPPASGPAPDTNTCNAIRVSAPVAIGRHLNMACPTGP